MVNQILRSIEENEKSLNLNFLKFEQKKTIQASHKKAINIKTKLGYKVSG